jgi:Helix-turn-helix domain
MTKAVMRQSDPRPASDSLGLVGLMSGGRRRDPGLRRDEVAMLAGVSVDYYARMERGDLSGVSPEASGGIADVKREFRCHGWLVVGFGQ